MRDTNCCDSCGRPYSVANFKCASHRDRAALALVARELNLATTIASNPTVAGWAK